MLMNCILNLAHTRRCCDWGRTSTGKRQRRSFTQCNMMSDDEGSESTGKRIQCYRWMADDGNEVAGNGEIFFSETFKLRCNSKWNVVRGWGNSVLLNVFLLPSVSAWLHKNSDNFTFGISCNSCTVSYCMRITQLIARSTAKRVICRISFEL